MIDEEELKEIEELFASSDKPNAMARAGNQLLREIRVLKLALVNILKNEFNDHGDIMDNPYIKQAEEELNESAPPSYPDEPWITKCNRCGADGIDGLLDKERYEDLYMFCLDCGSHDVAMVRKMTADEIKKIKDYMEERNAR